jgi:FAD:protein FMN transferase
VPLWFAAWEQHLSRFLPTSELSRLNDLSGTSVMLSNILWQVLQLAMAAAEQSAGLVTPTMLAALEAAGYDRDFIHLSELPTRPDTPSQGPEVLCGETWRTIVLDASTRSVKVPQGMRLDFGGIAKGWAADKAMGRLQAFGPALVDAGGDIAISGPRADGSPWLVAVANPTNNQLPLDLLMLRAGGVATSGRDYRRWQQHGHWQHHMIDPRTGRPAQTDLLTVTVVAPTVMAAEMAAKTVLLLGSVAGLAWIEARPWFAALLVTEDGEVQRSTRLSPYRWNET